MNGGVLLGRPTLCSCKSSGERNGVRIYNRRVCEDHTNKIGIEKTSMNAKKDKTLKVIAKTLNNEGIHQNTQNHKSNTRACKGIQRGTKEYNRMQGNAKDQQGIQEHKA